MPSPHTLVSGSIKQYRVVVLPRMSLAGDGRRRRMPRQVRDVGVEPGDPVETGLAEHVAADESAAADCCWSRIVAEQLVIELPTRECLDLVEAVADLDGRLAFGKDLQVEVGELRLGIVEADQPVVARGTGVLLDAGAADHDVVAALGVVVVVAALTDGHVVTGHVVVVEEQRRAVADQQVGHVAALHPVVAAVTEDGAEALTTDGEVVAGTHEVLVVVGTAVGEVVAVATHDDVVEDTAIDGVVAGTTLQDVEAGGVGDDVVAQAAEDDVVATTAVDDVVAFATPEGVVVVTAVDPVDEGCAVIDGLSVDARGVDAVDRPVLDAAIRLTKQQSVLVALRARQRR